MLKSAQLQVYESTETTFHWSVRYAITEKEIYVNAIPYIQFESNPHIVLVFYESAACVFSVASRQFILEQINFKRNSSYLK